ncbi:MAG: EAL domain-containing protein [Frankiaceae bacterium]|nr:EAL domain-containing protein [Frankiaceae bacterium]
MTDAVLSPEQLRAERRHLLAALDAMDVAVVVVTADRQVLHCNQVARDTLGFDPTDRGDEVLALKGHQTYREDGSSWPLDEWPHRAALSYGESVNGLLMEHRGPHGSQWVRVAGFPMYREGESSPYVAVGTFRNVTRQRARELALAESEAHFRLLAENAGDLIARHTVDGTCTYASPAARDLLGREPETLLGDWTKASPVHPDDVPIVMAAHARLASSAAPYVLRYRLQRTDGRWIWVETSGRPVVGADGAVVEIQSATRDVTARMDQEHRLARLALGDALTGLPNRAALTQFLEDQIEASLPVAVLFLDLDRFKVVNDSLGHSAGDELLRSVASRLSSTCRDGDMVARLGGDEFVLVAAGLNEAAAVALSDRVQRVLAVPVTVSGHELVISASIGIVLSDPSRQDQDAEGLLRDADISMYRAKSKGRGRVVVWFDDLGSAAVQRFGLEAELRAALERDELVVHYQPQVQLSTGRITCVEALVRWQHPTRGLLGPGEFLQVAEDSGLIVDLGRRVLRLAVEQVAQWRQLPGAGELCLAVNVSGQELLDPERLAETLAVLAEAGLPTGSLTVEVLEDVLFDDEGAMRGLLTGYVRAGVSLALDDFGTGSSSLTGLRDVPIQALKIDRAFVAGIGTSPQDEAIIRAIRSLTSDLGMDCIAEGVEEEAQRAWLTGAGVESGQGYLLHRPLPADVLERVLREGRQPADG